MVLWGNFSHPNCNNWKKFYPYFNPILRLLLIYQHKQAVFELICINSYPNSFLRRWGGCLAIPQRRWGPLGPHNTTANNANSPAFWGSEFFMELPLILFVLASMRQNTGSALEIDLIQILQKTSRVINFNNFQQSSIWIKVTRIFYHFQIITIQLHQLIIVFSLFLGIVCFLSPHEKHSRKWCAGNKVKKG